MQLSDPHRLEAQLLDLMLDEGRLAERGVTCWLKDRGDSCCSACPLFGTNAADKIHELCTIGREQERTTMSMLTTNA